jgi:hypothetical protein
MLSVSATIGDAAEYKQHPFIIHASSVYTICVFSFLYTYASWVHAMGYIQGWNTPDVMSCPSLCF